MEPISREIVRIEQSRYRMRHQTDPKSCDEIRSRVPAYLRTFKSL